jgi:hypothetical protein
MGKKSRSEEKVGERTMVLCPVCGGREFKFVKEMGTVKVYCTEMDIQKLQWKYEIVNISQNACVNQSLICKSCDVRLVIA